MSSLKNKIKKMSQNDWKDIPNNIKHETTITDNILTVIYNNWKTINIKSTSFIREQRNYTESETFADFVLLIKKNNNDARLIAFQSKIGKPENELYNSSEPNSYDVSYKIGEEKKYYQINKFKNWFDELKKNKEELENDFKVRNLKIEAYYLFYNGDYKNYDKSFNNKKSFSESYYALKIDEVIKVSSSNGSFSPIALSDIVNNNNCSSHIELHNIF